MIKIKINKDIKVQSLFMNLKIIQNQFKILIKLKKNY